MYPVSPPDPPPLSPPPDPPPLSPSLLSSGPVGDPPPPHASKIKAVPPITVIAVALFIKSLFDESTSSEILQLHPHGLLFSLVSD